MAVFPLRRSDITWVTWDDTHPFYEWMSGYAELGNILANSSDTS